MYYSFRCPYCSRIFYTYNSDKTKAAGILYEGIKKHLIEYDEDRKEHQFEDPPEIETNEVYDAMAESNHRPSGGFEL